MAGLTVISEKLKNRFLNVKYFATFLLLSGLLYFGDNSYKSDPDARRIASAGFGFAEPGKLFHNLESLTISDSPSDVVKRTFGKKIQAKKFYSVSVDDENTIWFLTEAGIISFDGKKWSLHNKNTRIPGSEVKDIEYVQTSAGRKILLASPEGATLASLPFGRKNPVNTFNTENSPLLSNNVISVATGTNSLSWIGTDKGISAVRDNKWLDYSYLDQYPQELFNKHPITSIATSTDGDSLYVATLGVGVLRVYRNDVDGISGASDYARWGPIYMPSDNVYSICIAPDGTQWFGTDMGVARHTGYNTLANWTVFDTKNGLINNFVQAIAVDKEGKVWFGTKNGISVFDGSAWTAITEKEGLVSANVLCIAVDNKGVVWIGTDNGVSSVSNGVFTNYN
ncbi:MAG: ligand-binding sensor domain-containing protein [Bacteroidales bacterium]